MRRRKARPAPLQAHCWLPALHPAQVDWLKGSHLATRSSEPIAGLLGVLGATTCPYHYIACLLQVTVACILMCSYKPTVKRQHGKCGTAWLQALLVAIGGAGPPCAGCRSRLRACPGTTGGSLAASVSFFNRHCSSIPACHICYSIGPFDVAGSKTASGSCCTIAYGREGWAQVWFIRQRQSAVAGRGSAGGTPLLMQSGPVHFIDCRTPILATEANRQRNSAPQRSFSLLAGLPVCRPGSCWRW